MKAFTEGDPDGDGKKDTIGFAGYVGTESMGSFGWVENVYNGTNGRWKLKDGKLVNTTLEPGTRDALIWLNKAYSEGIISPDFPTLKNSQVREMITSGKAGIFADAMNPSWLLTGQMRKTNPKADMLPLTYLEGPSGKYVPRDSGVFGMYAIPKTVPEAKMKQLLAFMDYGASEAGWVLGNYGIEGRDYNVQDGIRVATPQADQDNVSAFGQVFSNMDPYARAYQVGIPADFLKRNKQIIDERSKYSIPELTVGMISPTYLKVGKDYEKKIQDLKTKIIMGKEPIASWDAYVSQLKNDAQFQKITQEMNELYQKKQAK
jgi:putative aldouronate transport system substrate-binding protein